MYFNYGVQFNYILYIGLPSTTFPGLCRDKNDDSKFAKGGYTEGVSVFQCYDSCKIRHDCVAFAYSFEDPFDCELQVDGPYTHGSGDSDYTCYVIQGKNYSF